MEYKINPVSYQGIFPVPNAIVDENIRLASAQQLKVILYMLRHSTAGAVTIKDIASALFISEEDTADALIFWRERGLVLPQNETAFSEAQKVKEHTYEAPEEDIKAPEVKKVSDIPISRPTHEQIAARLSESQEIVLLLKEAQEALGQTIGYDGQSVLIMMYDSYGLPGEVILMAIEYAKSQGKKSFSNIAKIGKAWSELEIDTLEGAAQYIEEHNIVNETWNKLRQLTDISNRRPTAKQFGFLTTWIKEYGYDVNMIYYAYEEAVDRTGKMSMPYMDKIITGWHKNGVKTPLDIEKQKQLWKESHEKKQPKKGKETPLHEKREASYDINKFLLQGDDLVYNKNDKNN